MLAKTMHAGCRGPSPQVRPSGLGRQLVWFAIGIRVAEYINVICLEHVPSAWGALPSCSHPGEGLIMRRNTAQNSFTCDYGYMLALDLASIGD